MYKLLIIDDQIKKENREKIYEFMFKDRFSITCIDSEEKNILDALKKEYFDCVILDNNLNSGLEKEAVISMVTDYKYPIIMVSNVREFTVKEYVKDEVIDFISLNQYFNLRELQENSNEKSVNVDSIVSRALKDLHERVTYDIFTTRKYTEQRLEKVVICHMSDIQFCDPHVDENAIRTLFTKLEEFIINRETTIDLLVISGDIVFSGKKKEYNVAREAILKFQDKLKRQRKNVDIIFVPGNHDYNYQCYWVDESEKCQLDYEKIQEKLKKVKEEHGEKEWNEKELIMEVSKNIITPDYFIDFEASSFFLNNFCEFAYEITKENQYMNRSFFIKNEKYQNRGFTFVGTENAYKYHKNLDGAKRYIYELNSDIVENIKSPLYSICIGHVDPGSLGHKEICGVQEDRCSDALFKSECSKKGQCEKWGDMQRLFKRVNAIIYLYGHKHCSDIEISDDKKILFIGAASPTGISLSEKTVNVIEVKKNNNEIDVEIAVHRATTDSIAYIKTNKYQYDSQICEWKSGPLKK